MTLTGDPGSLSSVEYRAAEVKLELSSRINVQRAFVTAAIDVSL